MGTASIIVKREVLANLLLNYDNQITIHKAVVQDSDAGRYKINDEFYCEVSSQKLPVGYHGMQFVIINQWDVSFKADTDT